jgi:hypothetical protein
LKHIETTLTQHGVSVNKLKSAGKGIKNKLLKYHKQGLKPDQAGKEIMKDLLKAGKSEFMKVKKKFDLKAEAAEGIKKVLISIAFYILIVLVNTVIALALSASGMFIFNPMMLMMIIGVVVAPLVEESVKNYFIQKDMPWIGTGVVFGIEAITYVFMLMNAGFALPGAILVRVITLLMHFSTTAVQKVIMSKAKTPEEEVSYAWAGWVAGVMIHATWNTLGIMYNSELSALLK